ncbi:MAG TPA: DNA recombination protein RmuC [Chloroflexaceae bacterium]|nr:DNA recombination protein RmuC [Chloroflexaceae bacterium]
MDSLLPILLAAVAGAALAALLTWLLAAPRIQAAQAATTAERERAIRVEATLEAERGAHASRLAALQDAEQRLRDAFAGLSGEALEKSSAQFLQLAQERLDRQQQAAAHDLTRLVEPLRETLARQEQQVRALEEARQSAYGGLNTLLAELRQDQQALRTQTDSLIQSLRNPRVRGRWGEVQLRKLVELAGMLDHCDFAEQQVTDGDARRQRPDLVVRLPNDRQIVIDAKVPLDRFLDALEAGEEQRPALFKEHAGAIRRHIDEMGRRAYHAQIAGAHTFTVIFIPGEVFFQAALEHDHELLEYAFGKAVILASPTTLIAVLKSTALGWREEALSREARLIQEEGRKVYESLGVLAEHLGKVGKGLSDAAKGYNSAIGSIEERLLPRARRLHELHMGEAPPVGLRPAEAELRAFSRPELLRYRAELEPDGTARQLADD